MLNDESDDGEEEENAGRESIIYRGITLISDRMIALFFNEVEGFDRDWSEPYEFNDQEVEEADEPQ